MQPAHHQIMSFENSLFASAPLKSHDNKDATDAKSGAATSGLFSSISGSAGGVAVESPFDAWSIWQNQLYHASLGSPTLPQAGINAMAIKDLQARVNDTTVELIAAERKVAALRLVLKEQEADLKVSKACRSITKQEVLYRSDDDKSEDEHRQPVVSRRRKRIQKKCKEILKENPDSGFDLSDLVNAIDR